MPRMLDLARSLKTEWNPVEAEKLVADVLRLRNALPDRHHDTEGFHQLVAVEERIDAAYLAMDLPALRRAVVEWQTLATAAVPQGA